MPGNKKPRKKKASGTVRAFKALQDGGPLLKHQPWKLQAVFGTVQGIVDRIDTQGTVDYNDEGTPMFHDPYDQCWYPIEPSLRGMCDAFDIHSSRFNRPVVTAGLLAFIKKLKDHEEVDDDDIAAARDSIYRMTVEASHMTSAYATAIVRDSQIKFALEDHLRENE